MAKSILSTPEKQAIKLGEKEYHLAAFDLNVMADIEEAFDCSMTELGEQFDKRQAVTLRKILFILLKEEYPDITEIEIGKSITASNMKAVNQVIANVITRK